MQLMHGAFNCHPNHLLSIGSWASLLDGLTLVPQEGVAKLLRLQMLR